jgi:hypothetical protein
MHKGELNDTSLYCSPNIIRASKSRRMSWAVHVARVGEMRHAYRLLGGNLRERNHLEDPGVDGMKMLKWIFRKWDRSHTLD